LAEGFEPKIHHKKALNRELQQLSFPTFAKKNFVGGKSQIFGGNFCLPKKITKTFEPKYHDEGKKRIINQIKENICG